MNYNTIILLKGKRYLTNQEYKKFKKGDTIWGVDNNSEVLKRWNITQKDEALEELKKYKCIYDTEGNNNLIEEYALEFFEADEDGEFIQGSDYELAEEKM